MTTEDAALESQEQGATVVITHRVRNGHQADYDRWLEEVGPVCKASPGNLGLQIIRPIAGLAGTYTIVIRFDTREHLREWVESDTRKRMIEKVEPLLARGDDFFVRSGLDFWFTPEGARATVPVRWKQFLATWSAIYPVVLVAPAAVTAALHALGVPKNYFLYTLAGTGVVSFLMVYVVMPRYTKLLRRWLFA